MRGRGPAAAALLTAGLLLAGCVHEAPPGPRSQPPAPTATRGIRLADVFLGDDALAQRAGLYVCGGKLVAAPPAGGVEGDTFVVFDPRSGRGSTTRVRLPRGSRLQPNARWLLMTRCVDPVGSGGRPFVSVAYQEMPPVPRGGPGVRAAYTLDGERLWIRDDINEPATIVDDVLVLGDTAASPEAAVDLRTGETIARFDPSVQTRTVVAGRRVVTRGPSGPPRLTDLQGRRLASLDEASFFTADGGLLFGITPAQLPDAQTGGPTTRPTTGQTPRPTNDPDGPGNGPGDTGPTPTAPAPGNPPGPEPGDGLSLFGGDVTAYDLSDGELAWTLDIAPDALGEPVVEPETGVVVVVDARGRAHGIDPRSGRQLWQAATEVEHPRLTAAAGVVLLDKRDDRFQLLLDARTGLPLPEPEETIVDLTPVGALVVVDDVPRLLSTAVLRSPPMTRPADDTSG